MLKIFLCDDNAEQLREIYTAANCYFSRYEERQAELECFSGSLAFLDALDRSGGCDIALLDICMPGMLGTSVAREIRRRQDKTEIIFLTTSNEYAVDAFALKAAHYLMKPFTQEAFDEAMDRAVNHFAAGQPKNITIKAEGGEVYRVELGDILYIESEDHGLAVYTKDRTLREGRRSLARILEELEALSPRQFLSPYKGYIVNQRAILTLEREAIVLRNHVKIPIPKRGYKELKNLYFDYIFGEDHAEGEKAD